MSRCAAVIAGAGLLFGVPAPLYAFPEGAPWEAARGEACLSCHFGGEPKEGAASGLRLEGLPEEIDPGTRYALTLHLEEEGMAVAGFLFSVWAGEEEAGAARAGDGRVETQGAKVRNTKSGMRAGEGAAEWHFEWQAPETGGPLVLEIWANAADGDGSPFGDQLHHLQLERAVRD